MTAHPGVDLGRPAPDVARALLGCTLVSRVSGEQVEVRLTEVEAYGATDDPGSHAYRGRTPRNGAMYEAGGTVYVYSIYGLHELLNLVTGPAGEASAVLVRAGVVVAGLETALARRGLEAAGPGLARGPGNLAVCLGITRALDGVRLGPGSLLDLVPADAPVLRSAVATGQRVGLRDDGRFERYWVVGESSVSAFRPAKPARPAPE